MRHTRFAAVAAAALFLLLPTDASAMELDSFLAEIDLKASADSRRLSRGPERDLRRLVRRGRRTVRDLRPSGRRLHHAAHR